MDRKAKSLQVLGAFGIVGEAFKIIHSQAKLLGTITLVFILPFTLINLVDGLMAKGLLGKIISKENSEERKLPILQLTEFLMLQIVHAVFSYAVLMPFMAAVGYTVASVYTGNHKPSFAGVLKLVPAVWKRMIITCLWYFIINFVISMAFAFVVSLLALGFLVLGKSYWKFLYVALVVVCVVLIRVGVYVRIVWEVATVASVMEEEYYGLEGIKKSHRLVEGKRATAWVLTISYLAINNGVLNYSAFKGNVHVVGLGPKIAYGTALVGMACVVALMGALTQSVLYFVCKSHHGESIDGYLGEYQAVNNKDIESVEP